MLYGFDKEVVGAPGKFYYFRTVRIVVNHIGNIGVFFFQIPVEAVAKTAFFFTYSARK
jgi:hypothetical protein